MANLLSPPTLLGLGAVILITGGIILGLRAIGLPREAALYVALCVVIWGITLLFGYRLRGR